MREYKPLLKGIQQENKLNTHILELAKSVHDPDRLQEMLKGINIGAKRRFNAELRVFLYYNEDLPSNKNKDTNMTWQESFEKALDESDNLFDEIEEVITKKLGIDGVEKDVSHDKNNKNNFADFDEKLAELSLESSLKSIVTSNKIIQAEIPNMVVTEENYEASIQLLDDINEDAGNWLGYLIYQKKNRNFTLLAEEFLDLYDETIEAAKLTLQFEGAKRQEIEARFGTVDRDQENATPENTANTDSKVENNQGEQTQRQVFVADLKNGVVQPVAQRKVKSKRKYTLEDFVELDQIRNELTISEKMSKKILKGYRSVIGEDNRDQIEEIVQNVAKGGINRTTIASAIGSLAVGKMLLDIGETQNIVDRPGGGIFPPPVPHHHGGHDHGGR